MKDKSSCGYCVIILGGSAFICFILFIVIKAMAGLIASLHVSISLHDMSLVVFITCISIAVMLIIHRLVKGR